MKYLAFICSLFTSVLSQTIQPPDGTYFVFNVAFKNRVIDDAGRVTPGEPIIGYPIHKGQKSTNQQWLVQTTGYYEDIHSVSMQSLTSIERDFEEGGYVGDTDYFIVQSSQAVSWDLIPVQASAEKYMIIKDDVAITQVQGGISIF